MKIAYLILAHQYPEQLARLINRLERRDVVFHIHIDARSDIQPFSDVLANNPRVVFVKRRVKVFWKGYSQVEATLAVAESALPEAADHYVLISGVDYPLKPAGDIVSFFDGKTQYMHWFQFDDSPEWYRHTRYWHLYDSIWTNPRQGINPLAWRIQRHIMGKLMRRLPPRKYLPGLVPYGGSQWWALSHDCLEYCVEYFNNHPEFVRFYRYTESPDELVFQTIIMNSRFASSAANYQAYQDNRDHVVHDVLHQPLGFAGYNYRYIDWYHPERGFPSTLDESNWEEMVSREFLFARKMAPGISDKLLHMIDSRLLRLPGENLETQENGTKTT